ncbi:MAG: pantoate--beta-alanine ligase [Phycisphaerales bacterium]|nr:pantoate--beta-alanine ligase [Phycisphaerales bacterium]
MEIIDQPEHLEPFFGATLVATMGALHQGHAALIHDAKSRGLPVLVTVFVNPTQFGPTEDFSRYPRTFDSDFKLAQAAGATALFVPTVEAIYPHGVAAAAAEAAAWDLPNVATAPQLEDAFRPGHFGGVCQVVARLFDLCRPSLACFGEKDFQQLRVISEMVEQCRGRWSHLRIIPCPTVRDSDGLALSSRNRYLDASQRSSALAISRALNAAAIDTVARSGGAAAEVRMRQTLAEAGLKTQYAAIRDAQTLMPITVHTTHARAVIAAMLGAVRLIDNVAISLDGDE